MVRFNVHWTFVGPIVVNTENFASLNSQCRSFMIVGPVPETMPRYAVALVVCPAATGPCHCQPVRCGVPWPRGLLTDPTRLVLQDATGRNLPHQARILDRWADQSVRWLLLDWQLADPDLRQFQLLLGADEPPPSTNGAEVTAITDQDHTLIDTGFAKFELAIGYFPFKSVIVAGKHVVDAKRTRFVVEDEAGRIHTPRITAIQVAERGPVRATVRVDAVLEAGLGESLLDLVAYLYFFAGSAAVRFELTIRNSRKAEHAGGLWDLGNGGSIYLRDASLTVALPHGAGDIHAHCSCDIEEAFARTSLPLEIYQDSSGGENWRSNNHINRQRTVPNTFRGYRLRAGDMERYGLRATPAVYLSRGEQTLGLTMPHFWQNFPKAIEASADGALVLRLFPRQYAGVHEIQGGEQKTHSFFVLFGSDGPAEQVLAWCRSPAHVSASPEWYCSTGALPYLTPRADDPNAAYLQLVDAAIEGPDTFVHKREVIDEYGWRHFGDIYGDHEAVFHNGPAPLVSHYNNQYDPLAGFAYQFLRSGDPRWWQHMHELAMHVYDIDIYHTDNDKSAYNHGLFWHTFHYVDADTATHRTYPSAAKVPGGGPANEQNYTTGLMLHHFLTGDPRSREAAIGLARWVIDMDDGAKTVFRWLDRGYTGLASSSRTPSYHGPGRGAANSIAVLLDGHRLTGDAAFLAKAEQLIRRCIHPADNIDAKNLLDAENRWFYTMFLQSLGRYLDYKIDLRQPDRMYAYARASLLHYARWMADREYPYLEKPEILEYPTETWAAQDMRKSEVFKYAAKLAAGAERARFLERSEFFFQYSTAALSGMETRALCRPVVLLLSYGFMHAYFQHHPEAAAPPPAVADCDFGAPEVFVPQKVRAKQRLIRLAAGAAAVVVMVAIAGLIYWLRA